MHWDFFDKEKSELTFSTLVSFIKRERVCLDHPHTMKLLICVRDLVLFDFDFFPLSVSAFSGDLLLLFLHLLYESSNEGDKFLHRWGIALLAKCCLSRCSALAFRALDRSTVSSAWLKLHRSLRAFVGDFCFFYKYFDAIKEAAASMQYKSEIFSIICDVLECKTCEMREEDKNYYFCFVELLVSINFYLFGQGLSSDESYLYVVNSWEILFENVSFDFFEEVSQIPFLMNVLNQFLSTVQNLVQANEVFLGLIDSFSSFVCSFPDEQHFKALFFAFFQFLSNLLETENEAFLSPTISGVLCEMQRTFPDFYSEFIQVLFNIRHFASLLFFLSSSDRSLWSNFAEQSIRLLLSLQRAPLTALHFIRKIGVHFPEYSNQLISIAFQFIEICPKPALEVLEQYSLSDATRLVPFVPCFFRLAKGAGPDLLLHIFCALYRTAPFDASISPFLSDGILACIDIGSSSSQMEGALAFVTRIFESAPVGASLVFKHTLFCEVFRRLHPFLQMNDACLQASLTDFFIISISHSYVSDLTCIVRWVCSMLNTCVTKNTFVLCTYFIDLFPIEPILSFIYSFDYNSDNIIGSKIIDFVREVFSRSSLFWSFMRKDFLTSLLCIDNIVPVNSAFVLFFDICRERIDEGFSAMVVESVLRALPASYQAFQTRSAARLIIMMVSNGSTTARDASAALQRVLPACAPLADAFYSSCAACDSDALVEVLTQIRQQAKSAI